MKTDRDPLTRLPFGLRVDPAATQPEASFAVNCPRWLRLARCSRRVRACPGCGSLPPVPAAGARQRLRSVPERARRVRIAELRARAAELFRGSCSESAPRRSAPAGARVAQVPGRDLHVSRAQTGSPGPVRGAAAGRPDYVLDPLAFPDEVVRQFAEVKARMDLERVRGDERARAPRPRRPREATRPTKSRAATQASTGLIPSPAPSASRSGTRAGSRWCLSASANTRMVTMG